jgi:chemotaxis protein CheX
MSPDERTAVLTQVSAEMMSQIVESVFITMMNLEVIPYEIPWSPSHDQLTAVVHLSGNRNGTLLFECNRWEACRFTGRFLSMEPPDTVNDDVRDVLGELANMIGGNIKCAVASGLKLSMPSVTDGSDYGVRIFGSKFHRLGFECEEGPFWVTLMAVAPGEFPKAEQAIELSVR